MEDGPVSRTQGRQVTAKKGYGIGERHSQDPIGSDAPRGKDTSKRKHRNDPGWTPTEEKLRNQAMRQFMRNPEGSANRDESAYKASTVWCRGCDGKRMISVVSLSLCDSCAETWTASVKEINK